MTLVTGGTPKVLVRLPNWLGDLMMALPALRALRADLPGAELVAMARPSHRDLVGRITGLNGVLEAAPRNRRYRAEWAVVRALRQRRFDLAVVLAPSFEAALTVWLAGIEVRIGQATDHRAGLLTHAVPVRAVHQSQAFLDVVTALDGAVKKRAAGSPQAQPAAAKNECRLVCAPEERQWADRFFAKAGLSLAARPIFVNPAATKRPRAWSAERFVALVDTLAARYPDVPVVVHRHPPFEAPDGWPAQSSIHFLVDARLMEVVAIVERCRLYIGNNSGPMHVAAALGVPTIAVYGSTSPALTAPHAGHGTRHVAVSADFACSPCRERFFEECPSPPSVDDRPPCLNAIGVDQVAEAVDAVLSEDTDRG